MIRRHLLLAALGLVFLLPHSPGQAGGLALGRGAPAASQVKAEIAAEDHAMAFNPAGQFLAAVTLTTNPGWHIYWSNPGDAGVATTFKWNLPEGWKVEPLPFPVPTAFVQPGDIHVLGYEGKATFLFRVTPAGGIQPSHIAFTADWLCCNKDQCVPGSAPLELTLPPEKASDLDAKALAAAMERIPADTPPVEFAATARPLAAGSEHWRVPIGWAKLPAKVEAFAPAEVFLDMSVVQVTTRTGKPETGPLSSLNKDLAGVSEIEIKAHVYAGQTVTRDKIPLLVAFTDKDGKRKGFYVQLDAADIGVRPK